MTRCALQGTLPGKTRQKAPFQARNIAFFKNGVIIAVFTHRVNGTPRDQAVDPVHRGKYALEWVILGCYNRISGAGRPPSWYPAECGGGPPLRSAGPHPAEDLWGRLDSGVSPSSWYLMQRSAGPSGRSWSTSTSTTRKNVSGRDRIQ